MTSPQRVRFGYWTPIFGGWLRNVDDEQTPVSFAHIAEIARAAEEGRIRSDAHPRAEPQRHQGRRGAVARRLGGDRGTRRRDLEARAARGRAPGLPQPLPHRQAGGDHRRDQRGALHPQRRVGVVGRRGQAVRRPLQRPRRPLRPHDRVGRGAARPVVRDAVRVRGGVLPHRGDVPRAEAAGAAAPVRGRRERGGTQRDHALRRRVSDARGTLEELETKVADMRRRRAEAGPRRSRRSEWRRTPSCATPKTRRRPRSTASPMCAGERPTARTRTSSASRSSTPRSTSRSTRSRTAACAQSRRNP